MGSVRLGASYAVNQYLRVNPNHRVVIITDRKSSRLAASIAREAKRRTQEIHFFVMEDHCTGRRRKFPRELMALFGDPEQKVVSFYLSGYDYPDRYELLNGINYFKDQKPLASTETS